MDHHMAGCRTCGKVHRCETDTCEEILEGEPGFQKLAQQKKDAMRCPSEQLDDGTIVCTITGICIRTCSYGLEYELINRQGLHRADQQATTVAAASGRQQLATQKKRIVIDRESGERKGEEEGNKKKARVVGAVRGAAGGGIGALDGVFRVRHTAMKGEFDESNLSLWIRKVFGMIVQDKDVLYSKHMDSCERRDAVLMAVLREMEPTSAHGICMLSVVAKVEARIKSLAAGDAFTNSVQSFRDPFECLRVWTDAEVDRMVERIHPHIYRLMSVLKTIDSNKYKASNLPWMIVGMLYMCTCGHTIGNVMVLPRVHGLCNILPNDNRIHHYFGALGINTKCVTEMSNMIAGTLKGKEGALRVLQNV